MGIATPPPPPHLIIGPPKPLSSPPTPTSTSMSHGFHHHHQTHHHQGGIFGFSSDGFDRSAAPSSSTTTTTTPGNAGQHEHVAQQSRREKLRMQEFDPAGAAAAGHAQLVAIDDDGGVGDGEAGGQEASMYAAAAAGGAGHAAAASMLSEMFNFAGGGPSGADLLGYRQLSAMRPAAPPMAAFGAGDWYAGSSNKPQQQQQQQQQQQRQQQAMHHHPALTADSAMQLFLMNPPPPPPHPHQHARSPSPAPPPPPQPEQHTQALHHHQQALIQAFGDNSAASFGGGQGLSLSLSSSLQQFEMAKAAEELRARDAALLYYNQQQQQQQQQLHHLQLEGHGQVLVPPTPQTAQLGFGPAGVAAVLRSSKYARAAQELLEEFCSVGRGQFRSGRIGRGSSAAANNPNPKSGGNSGASSSAAAAGASTSSSKEAPPLSPAERFEHQRKKAKLISMLDEVERRYNHYCEQMQMVVNSFDSVMGFGAATPYTALAQKAMSRHFRCLKDAIAAQLRQACELLGEKDAGGGSGLTKGETPRLRILDQSLRQQRAFHHMGMMEQEAWRPQRGLPERSVNVLRAWLFEHFLHPYPSDADKHFLARQTGLSRNQVSNWFINARVRLWKPMVEEMYQQEAKERGNDDGDGDDDEDAAAAAAAADAASPLSPPSSSGVGGGAPPKSEPHPAGPTAGLQTAPQPPPPPQLPTAAAIADMAHAGLYGGRYAAAATHALRFGTAGDVSLTLGLRHGAAGGGGSGAGGGGGGGDGGGGRFGAVREFGS